MLFSTQIKSGYSSAQLLWQFACVCFLAMTSLLPAYAGQMSMTTMSMESSTILSVEAPLSGHSDKMTKSQTHHMVAGQAHNIDKQSDSSCEGLGCGDMPTCTTDCAMSTCCSVHSVSNATNSGLVGAYRDIPHSLVLTTVLITGRSDPLFRPPIR